MFCTRLDFAERNLVLISSNLTGITLSSWLWRPKLRPRHNGGGGWLLNHLIPQSLQPVHHLYPTFSFQVSHQGHQQNCPFLNLKNISPHHISLIRLKLIQAFWNFVLKLCLYVQYVQNPPARVLTCSSPPTTLSSSLIPITFDSLTSYSV